jgi:phosphoribosyl 1,2-cyclic phosphodiesterase
MRVFFTSLNSGSNGNCYYIGTEEEAILVDVGISCREVEKRMLRSGLSIRSVKAVFISHEHSDHIRGVSVLAKKYKLPVYITDHTLSNCRFDFRELEFITFNEEETIHIGSLSVKPFKKHHDAIDPHSFVIACGNIRIGVFTDIGATCPKLIHYFSQCHGAFLEANYDEELLARGHYPYYLKKRISGGFGHLSNREALALYKSHKATDLSYLILSHLSKENNCPELVKDLFEGHSNKTNIVVASRYEETQVFSIDATDLQDTYQFNSLKSYLAEPVNKHRASRKLPKSDRCKQLQLFD